MLSFITVTSSSSAPRRLFLAVVGAAVAAAPGFILSTAAQAQPGARCDGSQAVKLLGLPPRDWQGACWRLPDGREVLAAVPLPALVPASLIKPPRNPGKSKPAPATPLVVRLGLAKDQAMQWRGEIRPDAKETPDLREVLDRSEEFLVAIEDQALGAERGVRIGVVGHWGADTMLVREIALLFRLPTESGAAMRLVWSGLGNTRESRFDYCRIEGIASFQLLDERTLQREVHVSHNINREIEPPRARARELEKKCVSTPQAAQKFPLGLHK